VNPRLLLAVLEFQSRWVSEPNPRTDTLTYPLGWRDPYRKGLYLQLTWAANNLNRGYYLWRVNAVPSWVLADATVVPVSPTINAGTAALQYFFGLLYGYNTWEKSISDDGFFSAFSDLFGYPFNYTFDPLLPGDLIQPVLQLPFEPGVVWAFTGGPHGGWGDGSAWGALDFSPFVDTRGCFSSDEWVVAMADGMVIRAADGAVVQDLDNDGVEQTGWTILYMHIENRERVEAGTFLKAGDRIGHPSCEGGLTDGTHAHFARRYNGEWIPADQDLPFMMDGWISAGTGSEYNGTLQKGSVIIEAHNGNIPSNAIEK
jgi:murein DD-endopeptidase MepM/ murein hydrolase activator NlpD